jgi:tripartite ATP-independent transporter DctM subunit
LWERVNGRVTSICDAALRASEPILVASLAVDLVIVIVNVISRQFLGFSLIWGQEVSEFCLVLLCFVGAAVAFARDRHPSMDMIVRLLPARGRALQECLVLWVVFWFALWSTVASYQLLLQQRAIVTGVLQISQAWAVAPMVLGFLLTMIFAIGRLCRQSPQLIMWTGLGFLLLTASFGLAQDIWITWIEGSAVQLCVVGGIATALLILGVPVSYVLGCAALAYMFASGGTPIITLSSVMRSSLSDTILIAIPFFVLAGFVMDKGGVTNRLVLFLESVLGRSRGGLLQVEIIAMYIFSGISGSKAADMAAVGGSMGKVLAQRGYPADESVAVLAASAAMGETIPPSLAMIILGAITTLSVGALFAAGLVPATVIAILLMTTVWIRARIVDLPRGSSSTFKEVLGKGRGAVLPMVMPGVLIGGVVLGIATPSEVSAFAVAYGLFVAMVVYRAMHALDIYATLVDAVTMGGMVLLIIATSIAFSWVLTVLSVPTSILQLTSHVGGGATGFLIGTSLAVVVMGSMFEGFPALLIFAPLLLPAAHALGISTLHYGIVLVIAMGVGAFAPPIGVGFYIACAIGGAAPRQAMRRMLPYFVILVLGLLLIDLLPGLTLVVPAAVGMPTQ